MIDDFIMLTVIGKINYSDEVCQRLVISIERVQLNCNMIETKLIIIWCQNNTFMAKKMIISSM